MGREKALAFIALSIIAVVALLKNAHVLHSRGYLSGRERPLVVPELTLPVPEPVRKKLNVAICIITQRGAWERRHLLRQTWLQDVPEGVDVSHIFVMGEDKSFTKAENGLLADEVKAHQDILINNEEEGPNSFSAKTKQCIYWVTKQREFDILIKADDDTTLFLSRLVGANGWLSEIKRDDFVYFGKKHPLNKVANPANFEPNEMMNTFSHFEFEFRGVFWPDYMYGGMYGFSRRLAEEIVKNDFQTYASEDAMVGVWLSALRSTGVLYLTDDQVVLDENDYQSKNGTNVVVAFHTDPLHLASMWCEYGPLGTLSRRAMNAEDPQRALDCLGSYQRAALNSRSNALGARKKFQDEMLARLSRVWPIEIPPNLQETGKWWSQMNRVFRGRPAAVIGNGAAVDRLPLYMLQGMHSLVFDDFFQVSGRYASWTPTMYMCVDPALCASEAGGTAARKAAGGRRATTRSGQPRVNVESANQFARDVFAAFYMTKSSNDAEYWRYLRDRVNVHWFVNGESAGESEGDAHVVAGMAAVMGVDGPTQNFRVASRVSGVAMAVEVLSYLGFSPIYIAGARDEVKSHWSEVSNSLRLASSMYGAEVIYLYGHDADRLEYPMMGGHANDHDKTGKLATQQNFVRGMRRLHGKTDNGSPTWEIDLFSKNFPVISRLVINREASTLQEMFPRSPRCRDAEDLDRFQKAVLCPVKISLKHFSSFLAWHVPYGPVGDEFVWAKR